GGLDYRYGSGGWRRGRPGDCGRNSGAGGAQRAIAHREIPGASVATGHASTGQWPRHFFGPGHRPNFEMMARRKHALAILAGILMCLACSATMVPAAAAAGGQTNSVSRKRVTDAEAGEEAEARQLLNTGAAQ